MEEQRGISSGISSEPPPSISGLLREKRNGNGLQEKDEQDSKRVKPHNLDSVTKTCYMQQSDTNLGVAHRPKLLSSEETCEISDADGLASVMRDKQVLAKDLKPPKVVETGTCLPESVSSVATDDDRCVASSEEQALLENVTVKDDSNLESLGGHVDGVSNNGTSLLKPRVACAGSSGESDSMRKWMEMKRNGFVSGPLGGVAAPSSAVSSTPVEIPAQKQQKNKRRSDSFKKRNEVPPRKEHQQVDRFLNVAAPSGLLMELNPGIINNVRSKKQVCSVIEALLRNATEY